MTTIHLLESDANRKGDLFNRLARDLLHSLGYDSLLANVGKSGREIDLQGQHRLEPWRYVRAECKATRDTIGGADINKFAGALDAERRAIQARNSNSTVAGYFISLAGFKDAAIEQEAALPMPRLTLLAGSQVVDQLITGRIIVSREQAVDLAARNLPANTSLRFMSTSLLVHETGMYWAVEYGDELSPSHATLIHGSGFPLTLASAESVLKQAKEIGITVGLLTYLPPPPVGIPIATLAQARASYLKYLEAACGDIQLDGLPADEQIGAKRLRLESVVPLHVVSIREQAEPIEAAPAVADAESRPRPRRNTADKSSLRRSPAPFDDDAAASVHRRPIGQVLASESRLALLAAPGGGKSTLLKRLAVAYGFPERRGASSDNLPDRDWFPLFIRCRELGDATREPIRLVLSRIARRAEMDGVASPAFDHIVSEVLASGRALLLIDGLDEITDDGDRIAFVASLRTFIATYPSASVVVTSREAGFRSVAGAMASSCERYRLADFVPEDIHMLIRAWHAEVYGETTSGTDAATDLANTIISNDRIRLLAGNPLLLTTLLLVKRWVGHFQLAEPYCMTKRLKYCL